MKSAVVLWAGLYAFISQYVFDDWSFTGYLMVLVMADTATGIRASLILKQHQSGRLRQVFGKLFQYTVALVCCHALTNHLVDGHTNSVFQVVAPGFKASVYLLLLWTEVISIEENLQKTGQGFLPKWVRNKMASWTENGESASTPTPPTPNQENDDPTL